MAFLLRAAPAGAEEHHTPFDPATQAFAFPNHFADVDDKGARVHTRIAGLAGGMVYAALDFLNAKRSLPRETDLPADGAPLTKYLRDRQATSVRGSSVRWSERLSRPGSKTASADESALFKATLPGGAKSPLVELKASIDRDVSVPLGLVANAAGPRDHQVLAIGYDLGSGESPSTLRIFVYDPNHPNRTMILAPDLVNEGFTYLGAVGDPPGTPTPDERRWRSFFVDKAYAPVAPPSFGAPVGSDGLVHQIAFTFTTGGDDLRGGEDNLDLVVELADGTQQRYPRVNGGNRFGAHSTQVIPLTLVKAVAYAQMKRLVLTTTFKGGPGGDNWELAGLLVDFPGALNAPRKTVPAHRFTDTDKTLAIPLGSP